MAKGNAFHLDLLGHDGFVDDLFVRMDDRADAYPAGQFSALADNRLLLDHGNDLALLGKAMHYLRHFHPINGQLMTRSIDVMLHCTMANFKILTDNEQQGSASA